MLDFLEVNKMNVDNTTRWARTLLMCYKHTDNFIRTLEGSLDEYARRGFYSFGSLNSNLDLMDKMLETNYRIDGFHNLKVLVENAMQGLKERERKTLELRFWSNLKTRQIADKLNTSERNCFRWCNSATAKFFENVKKQGFDEKRLSDEYGKDKIVMAVYSRAENKLFNYA